MQFSASMSISANPEQASILRELNKRFLITIEVKITQDTHQGAAARFPPGVF